MPERFVEYLPLAEITPAHRNPKLHDETGIKRSIDHFGLAEVPLIDERTGRLVAGHGRHTQLVKLQESGAGAPEGVRVDPDGTWLMPVIRGWSSRSDDDADAYLVASNRLTATGGWDDHQLTEMLADLAEAQMLEVTGYDSGDLEAMEALLTGAGDFGGGADDEAILDASDRAGWPIIRAQVHPDVYERFQSIDGDDDAQKVRVLLDRAGVL